MGNSITVSVDPKTLKDAIEDQTRLAIVEALGRNKDALVEAVVRAAISEKGQGYGQTPFRAALDRAIRDEAERAVKDLLVEQRPRIQALLRDKITGEHIAEKVFEQALEAKYYVSLSLTDPAETEVD